LEYTSRPTAITPADAPEIVATRVVGKDSGSVDGVEVGFGEGDNVGEGDKVGDAVGAVSTGNRFSDVG